MTYLLVAGSSILGPVEPDPVVHASAAAPNFHEQAVLHLAAQDPDPAISDKVVEPTAPFGAKDSWRWFVQAGFAHEFNDESELYLAGVGVSYFMADDLSLDLELNGFHVDQMANDATVANFNLLIRWHFESRETWSIYFDGGAGLSYASDELPAGGSQFNFTPQAGVGVSIDVGRDARLLTGVRWHHMSNARTSDDNPGRDAAMVYAQLSFPF